MPSVGSSTRRLPPGATFSVFHCRNHRYQERSIRRSRFQRSKIMGVKLNWNRRGFLGGLGAIASLFVMPRRSFGWNGPEKKNTTLTGFGASGNPYEELGVTTVINAEGTMTTLGGSLIRPEVEVVMA